MQVSAMVELKTGGKESGVEDGERGDIFAAAPQVGRGNPRKLTW